MQTDIPSLEPKAPHQEMTLAQRLASVKLLAIEVEGVISDGVSLMGPDGSESIKTYRPDVWAMENWLAAGRQLVIVSRPGLAAAEALAEKLGCLYRPSAGDKGLLHKQTMFDLQLRTEDGAYLGCDLDDLPALTVAGLAICPAQASVWVKEACHLVGQAPAGRGLVREVIDRLLEDYIPEEG
jgi:3-deoxy-D-manno-octulosonate 8-phosphate phosphatase (KDO 8-P phosphatase)